MGCTSARRARRPGRRGGRAPSPGVPAPSSSWIGSAARMHGTRSPMRAGARLPWADGRVCRRPICWWRCERRSIDETLGDGARASPASSPPRARRRGTTTSRWRPDSTTRATARSSTSRFVREGRPDDRPGEGLQPVARGEGRRRMPVRASGDQGVRRGDDRSSPPTGTRPPRARSRSSGPRRRARGARSLNQRLSDDGKPAMATRRQAVHADPARDRDAQADGRGPRLPRDAGRVGGHPQAGARARTAGPPTAIPSGVRSGSARPTPTSPPAASPPSSRRRTRRPARPRACRRRTSTTPAPRRSPRASSRRSSTTATSPDVPQQLVPHRPSGHVAHLRVRRGGRGEVGHRLQLGQPRRRPRPR